LVGFLAGAGSHLRKLGMHDFTGVMYTFWPSPAAGSRH
jgi:hypothetical protein